MAMSEKVSTTLHLTREAADILSQHASMRTKGKFVSELLVNMATIEAASEQSAKLPPAGSTPAVASVWVFNVVGEHSFFPVAVFSSLVLAEDWIMKKKPVGVLTRYYLDKPENPDFPEHYHYEDEDDYFRRTIAIPDQW